MRARDSIGSARAFAARMVDRAAWHSGGAWARARLSVRAALARAGVPIQQEFLELGCASGVDASGVFSEVAAVLGCVEHYERWSEVYAGLRVNFAEHGLYYEPAAGPNWWEYYFEPVRMGGHAQAALRLVPQWQHDLFADRTERELSRTTAAALVTRHIRVKPVVHDQVECFWRDHCRPAYTIGVHYRGTDKSQEEPVVPYEMLVDAVREALPAVSGDWTLFVATDEQAFLNHMIGAFSGKVICRPVERSIDGRPVHKAPGGGFQKGLDAIVDCLLLSRCGQLIRTPSDLGLVATYFNPVLPVTLLTRQP